MISTERLSDLFVDVADTLVDSFDIIDFLHTLTLHVAEISEASAVGLLLADQRGRLQVMASTSEAVRILELHQLQVDEGPCLDCYRGGEHVVHTDLPSAGERWPSFAPRAVDAGYLSVHAFPMRLRNEAIGALNLFGVHRVDFDSTDIRVVQALADVATIAIMQERNVTRAEALTEQLQGALNSRVLIEQAKGAVAQIRGVNVDVAFDLLRLQARSNGLRLADVARSVLAGDISQFEPERLAPKA